MPGAKKNFIGLEGFIWWIGVVEDRNDPEQLGRIRVRCFGWHTEQKEKIPTDALPWAHPIIPVNSPVAYTAKEGDYVFGFFIDGESAQNPAVVGVLPGKPEKKPDYQIGFSDPRTNLSSAPKRPDDGAEAYPKATYLKESTLTRLARGKEDKTVIATRKKNQKKSIKSAGGVTWSEPAPAFAPKYPYNYALETESGHAFELDDTPGKERVHLAHRNGSYFEIDSTGNKVERVQKDNYEVIMGDDFIYVKGKAVITVDGDFNLKTSTINIEAAAINMASSGDIKIKGKDVKIESTGSLDMKIGGVGKITSGGKLNLKGATAALAGATVDIPAGKIGLQSGSADSASGAGISGGGTSAAGESTEAATANGSSASSNTAAGGDGLQEVTVTGKKTAITEPSKLGKLVGGLSSTVSSVFSAVTSAADGLLKDFAQNLPIGQLTAGTNSFQDLVNTNRGDILSLKDTLKTVALDKIDQVAQKALGKSIPFSVDSDIQSAIDVTKGAVTTIKTVLAKHTYPKTETLEEVVITSTKNTSNTG